MAETTPGASASPASLAPAYRGDHEIKPLPFDPTKLRGLSVKLITSHHQNNYAGAVRRLNQIQQQIGAMPKDAFPFQLGALKREELIASNSMILHELYFANLGGEGKPSGEIQQLVQAEYGTIEAWEDEFRLGGLSLAGGSGWMILAFDPRRQSVHNHWAGDHTQGPAGGVPLLVMDMYEHSYAQDYGANARSYIDSFLQNVDWHEVDRRAERARRGKEQG
jgi:Fe-Mn family superoxide dismutase